MALREQNVATTRLAKQHPVILTNLATPQRLRRASAASSAPRGLAPLVKKPVVRPASSPPRFRARPTIAFAAPADPNAHAASDTFFGASFPFLVPRASQFVKTVAPDIEEFYAAMERSIEKTFSEEAAPSPLSRVPVKPAPPTSEPQTRKPSTRPARRYSAGAFVPPKGATALAAALAETVEEVLTAEPGVDDSPSSHKISAQQLGAMLDRLAPAPTFHDAPTESQSRLAESGEGQAKLRSDIAANMRRVTDVFRELDADGNGEVDRHEFRKGLRQTLPSATYDDGEIDELFDVIDISCDGKISYRELARTLRPPPSTKPILSLSPPILQPQASGRIMTRAASASAAMRAGAVAAGAGSSAEAGGDSSASAGQPSPPTFLHPLRQREVLRLFSDFKQQHSDGVCKVGRFDKLLRLKYPTESKEHVAMMMQLVIEHEAEVTRLAEEKEKAAKDAKVLFDALDSDSHGSIDIDEFLNIKRISEVPLSKSELRALFTSMDADKSGTLDLEEFKVLLRASDMLGDHHAELVKGGNALKEMRNMEQKSKEELWKVGVPEEALKPRGGKAGGGEGGLSERPSLVSLSSAMLNMRRAIQKGGSGAIQAGGARDK